MLRILCIVLILMSPASLVLAANVTMAVPVWMFGHSYNDTESSLNLPGYGPTFAEYGFYLYNNAAHSGAQAYDYDDVSPRACHAEDNYQMDFGPGPSKACNMFGVFQMKRHPTTGACESFAPLTRYPTLSTSAVVTNEVAGCGTTGNPAGAQWDSPCCATSNCVPTCLEDRVPSPPDLCVIDFLANDTTRGSDTPWVASNPIFLDALRDYEAILDHATAHGLRCLVATGLPNLLATRPNAYPNAQLLIDTIKTTLIPGTEHRVIDSFALWEAYKVKNGEQAAFDLYRRAEQESDGSCDACTHPGITPNDLGDDGFRWLAKQLAEALVGLVD